MSDENGGDRSQKTVAELLALHGSSTGSSRRRHRRAADADDADDAAPASGRDVTDTAPQAIIDRIKGEGDAGKQSDQHSAGEAHGPSRVAQRPPQQQPQQASWPQPAQARHDQQSPPPPQQQSRPMPRPPSPTNGHAPAAQPPQRREQPAPEPNGSQGGTDQHRADQHRADEPGAGQGGVGQGGVGHGGAEPTPQPRSRGGFPRPPAGRRAPLRPAQRREPEPNTDRFPALGGEAGGQNGHAQPTPDVSASAPPAGLTKWRQRRQKEQAEETDIGVVPPVPADADPAAPVAADVGPPTGAFTPSFDTGPQSSVTAEPGAGQYTDGETGYADYDYYDDQHYGYDERDQNLDYDDEFEGEFAEADYADEDEGADLEEPEDEPSPARQWLLLAGQLALGVVAGAGVWLGFSWLWGQMPSAALVAALLATLGLVWVVRKVRRAEDTQTTVLALLVGLVVTVSPAALLLVSR